MTQPPDRGDERDAYLSEALRHAPDAGLAPPAALSDAILREARSAPAALPTARAATARTAPNGRPGQLLADLWSWLARPPVAAGFASVLAATLVGMMWWDRPIDDALPHRPEPAAAAPAAVAQKVEQPATAAPAGPSVAAAPTPAARALSKSPPANPQAPTEASKRAAPQRAEPPAARVAEKTSGSGAPAAMSDRAAAEAARAPPQGSLRSHEPGRLDTDSDAVARNAPQPFPAAPGLESKAVAPSAKKEQAGPEISARNRLADTASADAMRSAPPAMARATAGGDARPSAQSAQSAARLASRMEDQGTPSPLGPLRAALAREPRRWTWGRDDGSTEPMNTAVQRWLGRLDEAVAASAAQAGARAGGSAAARRDAGASDPGASTRTLRLLRDGRLHMTLRLDDRSVRADTVEAGAHWQAPLDPAAGAALKAGMPVAPR